MGDIKKYLYDMPVVLRLYGFKFLFYSDEGTEPPHVHVLGKGAEGKYWIRPVRRVFAKGFTKQDERRVERAIAGNLDLLNESWDEFFS